MNNQYTGKNLQGKSFKRMNLQNENFSGADLRGADFSFANLAGADFTKSVTGLRTSSRIFVFVFALVISLLSGYIAMLSGNTVQSMLKSGDANLKIAAYITVAFAAIFIAVALWKGIFKAINKVFIVLISIAVLLGLFMRLSGLGTGMGTLYGSITLLLMLLMFIVGTISRATAGTLASNILFIIVALGGGMFGKSLGGGIGTVVMALSCAIISKRALKQETGSSVLKKVALTIGSWFGTSFKGADLTNASFSDAVINNTSFSNAKLDAVNWTNAKKQFVLENNE